MKKDFAYLFSFNLFCSELADSITSNNISLIKKAMNSPAYGSLIKEEKEFEAFKTVYQSVFLFGNNNELLQYLIFDYKISEVNSIDKIKVDDKVKAMFQARNLSNELSTELDDKNKPNKKLKV